MIRFIKLLICMLIITGGVFFWKYYSFTTQKVCIDSVDGYLKVEKGETFRSTLSKIYENRLFIKLYLKQHTPDFELQAGKYEISCGNISQVIESLKRPMNETDVPVTFLEGWNIYDLDQTLAQMGLIEVGEFSDYASNRENIRLLLQDNSKKNYEFLTFAQSLEGFLYPDTYAINPNSFTVENLVRKMLDRFEEKVFLPYSKNNTNLNYKAFLDEIIMASIVQKEANKRDNPDEIALIAGILKKRLDEGWQIGADATVCYAYRISTQDCTPNMVLKYLYEKNEYNTRQMTGLPVGPIANPEAEVIEATINSRDSEYYYYLHDPSGQIHYGISGADHEANKQKYLR